MMLIEPTRTEQLAIIRTKLSYDHSRSRARSHSYNYLQQ